jgi:DNA-binding transcriptional MerR regulator
MAKQPKRKVGGPWTWVPGDPTLTVGEIAAALAPIEPDVEATVQRIRHWTREGMLLPVNRLHAGTGKHRQYAADAVYDAAVLHVFTSNGLNVSSMRHLVDALTFARFALPKWKSARSKGLAPTLYLFISRKPDKSERTVVGLLEDPAELKLSVGFTMIIDLADLFTRVARPSEGAKKEDV